MNSATTLVQEETIRKARKGEQSALETLVTQIQGKIYGLALRMLWHPEDAQDATQEILLRVITHLSSFRGDSSFVTWVYRIAANHLLSWRRSRLEAQQLTFESFGKDLGEGLSDEAADPDDALLFQEIRVGCTLGMLLCLDREHRLAYILGEIVEIPGDDAAAILNIQPATYRKRLQRARKQIVEFMKAKCGLANSNNACRCHRRKQRALALQRINPASLLFAGNRENAARFPQVLSHIRKMEEIQRTAALYQVQPELAVPDFNVAIRRLLKQETG